jgi:hypothetical protein
LKPRVDYLVEIKNWAQKYLNPVLSNIDVESIKEQVDDIFS